MGKLRQKQLKHHYIVNSSTFFCFLNLLGNITFKIQRDDFNFSFTPQQLHIGFIYRHLLKEHLPLIHLE